MVKKIWIEGRNDGYIDMNRGRIYVRIDGYIQIDSWIYRNG